MANKSITSLTAASTLDGSESIHVVQSGNSRKTTLDDIATIVTGQSNAKNWAAGFRGAVVRRVSSTTPSAFAFLYPWDTEDIDTDGFWTVSSATRMTIPAGITKIRLNASVDFGTLAESSAIFCHFYKNGAEFGASGGGAACMRQYSTGYTNNQLNICSAPIIVAENDYFEVRLNYSGSNANMRALAANAYNFFALEVLETSTSLAVPFYSDIQRLGSLVNSETLRVQVAAQAFDVPASGTGSKAYAATGPSSQTILSLKKNGSEFGTITFASSATTGTFTIASNTSFAVGDVLTVVAPSNVNGMADLSIMLKQVMT